MQFLPYKEFTDQVRGGGDVPLRQFCNGWAVTNVGTDIAVVNGKQCLPPAGAGLSGETVGMSGNYGEVYDAAVVQIVFLTQTGPHVELTQKVYSIKKSEQ